MVVSYTQESYAQKTETQTQLRTWKVVSASVRGTSHEKTGQPCQDAHHWEILPEGILVAAVADGAGSADLGEIGAEIAVRTAVEAIVRPPRFQKSPRSVNTQTVVTILKLSEDDESWQLLLMDALKATRTAIKTEAEAREVSIRDLATTLILVAATPELIVAAQVGDGVAVASDDEEDIIALTVPQSGEYINETNFLISPDALDTAQITVCRGSVAHIAILSDGLQLLALRMSDGTPYEPFFSPLFRFVTEMTDETEAKEELKLFLRSKRVRERTSDDLTLLLATLVNGRFDSVL